MYYYLLWLQVLQCMSKFRKLKEIIFSKDFNKELWEKMPINFGVTSTLIFPVWLRNRIISAGSEPIHSHTEKSCLASLKNMNHKINSSFVRPVGGYKTGFNLINFHFNTRGKLLPFTRKQGVKMRYLEKKLYQLFFYS